MSKRNLLIIAADLFLASRFPNDVIETCEIVSRTQGIELSLKEAEFVLNQLSEHI